MKKREIRSSTRTMQVVSSITMTAAEPMAEPDFFRLS